MTIDGFETVLRAAGPRPEFDSPTSDKIRYAMKFANAMATFVANGLRPHFPDIKPDRDGQGVESPAQAVRGLKKLDVNFGTTQAGLGLGISLKSVHIRDKKPTSRFTHNLKRNDEELRVEAAGYHQRQPYAVLVAIMVIPIEACQDGTKDRASSFGKWVQYLWPLSGRNEPNDAPEKFELVFVGLYDVQSGAIVFFDVRTPPPKTGLPPDTQTFGFPDLIEKIVNFYNKRNGKDFYWSDGSMPESGAEP